MPGRLLSNIVTNITSPEAHLRKSQQKHHSPARNGSTTSLGSARSFKSEGSTRSNGTTTGGVVSGVVNSSMDLLKRAKKHTHGVASSSASHGGNASSQKNPQSNFPAALSLAIESPALVSYNVPAQSSGALFSGQLQLRVTTTPGPLPFQSISAKLTTAITLKKPLHSHCPDCSTRTTELKAWEFVPSQPTPLCLAPGTHSFPFSYLFPGSLPASGETPHFTISYTLTLSAQPVDHAPLPSYSTPIPLTRCILPGADRTSLRIFPPTPLTASLQLPPVLPQTAGHTTPLTLTVHHVADPARRGNYQCRWRLRRLHYRLEELTRTFAPACAKHAADKSATRAPPEGDAFADPSAKGAVHEESRALINRDVDPIKTPWKSDWTGAEGGSITATWDLVMPGRKRGQPGPAADLHSPALGVHVKHVLALEMVVAEEMVPLRNGRVAHAEDGTPTGAARILRGQFQVVISAGAAAGVSGGWDEEIPPMYKDVPESPPGYARGEVGVLEVDEEGDGWRLGSPVVGPVREGEAGEGRAPAGGRERFNAEDLLLLEVPEVRGGLYDGEEEGVRD